MQSKQVKLTDIRLDGGTQPRTDVDHDVIDTYAEAYRSGAKFPPAVVFFDGKEYWLADGFHRWWASRKADRKAMLCDIHNGTQQDAQWYSYSANRTHGLNRSNQDKQRAVRAALLHPNGAQLSDSQIAEHVGVAVNTVCKYRAEMESTLQIAKSPDRTGRDGRTINTANIGRKAVVEEVEEEPASEPSTADEFDWDAIEHEEGEESTPVPAPPKDDATEKLWSTIKTLYEKSGKSATIFASMLESMAARLRKEF